MVKRIKGIQAQLELKPLSCPEIFPHGKIEVPVPRAIHDPASSSTETICRRRDWESGCVKPVVHCALSFRKARIAYKIHSGRIEAVAPDSNPSVKGERSPRLQCKDIPCYPSFQGFRQEPGSQIRLARSEWQLI